MTVDVRTSLHGLERCLNMPDGGLVQVGPWLFAASWDGDVINLDPMDVPSPIYSLSSGEHPPHSPQYFLKVTNHSAKALAVEIVPGSNLVQVGHRWTCVHAGTMPTYERVPVREEEVRHLREFLSMCVDSSSQP